MCIRYSVGFFHLTYSPLFRARKDLGELSSLGHFLKGSSAALGLTKVQLSCEHIQHYGHLREVGITITEADAIVKLTTTIVRAREEYAEAKIWLDEFFTTYSV